MSVGTGVTAPVQLCRRLFGEPVSRIRIQQTLETIIHKDLDRFQNKWNFKPSSILPEKKIRKPLAIHQLHNGNVQKQETNEFILEPLQSAPSFYTRSPRKLKAFRRLPVSNTQSEIGEYPYTVVLPNNFTNNDVLNDNQKPIPMCLDTTTAVSHPPPTSSSTPCKKNISSSLPLSSTSVVKSSVIPVTPIIIRSDNNNHGLLASSSNPPQHSVKLIKSDRLSLKKSGPKVTDYFAVKRRRQSMK
uniref:Uncharacterized protein n=1 Tax=Trichobilharzia regenti TaxID=157069 RepID=A0AA85JM42_TRIRE|nr:unnamed protein product [Trichobilharzia regenti]